MQINFYGAAQEVGRSAIMLQDQGRRVMLDYGVKLWKGTQYPVEVPNVDALILSHAHLDHCGAVPMLYRNRPNIPTLGTPPTLDLAELLLRDSLKIARIEHKKAKFTEANLASFKKHYRRTSYHSHTSLLDMDISMYDAGHLTGSAVTLMERRHGKENKRIVYTGDFKIEKQTLHEGAEIVKSDVLIMESTYAQRNHPERTKVVKDFVERVKEVIDNGGNVLLPVFALGRGQEMLTILYEAGLAGKTYVDGMINPATQIVMKHSKYIKNSHKLFDAVEESNRVRDQKDRHAILEQPSIILTTAGMLEGGPVLSYINKLNDRSHIFITGYQVEDTNGRRLIDKGVVNIDGKETRIKTPVSIFDFSAHAGHDDLYKYVRESSPNTVICVHGSEENSKAFAEALKGEGFDAHAPKIGDVIKLAD
jgi:putative mRNA 3-end processing factor